MTEQELRERVRKLISEVNPEKVDRQTFRGAQFDHGLALVHFPEGMGGLGLPPKMQAVVDDELRKLSKVTYENMNLNPIGIGMGMPVLATHGKDEKKKRELLRKCYTGEEIWCQLFSEPGAGSDVAGLATRAVRDGDDWVVNGQKVWTTLAHVSKWGMLVARTDPDAPKHEGMSYFLVDMQSPGVEVRPLYQITGEAEFNEVFFNDVRIPNENLLGEVGEGWQVAITTLMNERSAIGGASTAKGAGPIGNLLKLWHARRGSGRPESEELLLRDRITKLWIEAELLRITTQRARAAQKAGTPGPEGSVGKLAWAELNQRIAECAMDVLGTDALLYEPGYGLRRPSYDERPSLATAAKYQFLRSRANTIEGGTSDIMRNILGERVLGLPGEPRADKGMPWKDIPRG